MIIERSTSERRTVHALSTAAGKAGVAVLRVTGPNSGAVLIALAGQPLPQARKLAHRTLRHPVSSAVVDRGLVVFFQGPNSFTGEDMAEFHGHGGRAAVAALLEALNATGLTQLAEPGDFTRRAFENGKLDLSEAEGLADLVDAETELQRTQAISQSSGFLRNRIEDWRRDLIAAMALVEAAIDFSDEPDVPVETMGAARSIGERIEAAMQAALADGRRGEIVRDGFRVVLAGPPNAGKSSLLNALASRDVAIVSPEAGTTRDVIEVALDLDGVRVTLFDTAGVRSTESAIEQEGIRRTVEGAHAADMVLWLVETGRPPEAIPSEFDGLGGKLLTIVTKADLSVTQHSCSGTTPDSTPSDAIRVSAKTGQGLLELTSEIARLARAEIRPEFAALITRHRHRLALEAATGHLHEFLAGHSSEVELRAEDLRLAAGELGRIIGAVDVEDILDRIFSSFCIGK